MSGETAYYTGALQYPSAFRSLGYGLKLVTAPTVEPVKMTQAKDWLRVTSSDEDGIIATLTQAAREAVERDTRLRLITQTWDMAIDRFPTNGEPLDVILAPLLTVTSITSYDIDDASSTFSAASYFLDTYRTPGRICLKSGQTWPTGLRNRLAAVIRFTCGFGPSPDNVPQDLAQAVRMQLAALYDDRAFSEDQQRYYHYLIDPWVVHYVGD